MGLWPGVSVLDTDKGPTFQTLYHYISELSKLQTKYEGK